MLSRIFHYKILIWNTSTKTFLPRSVCDIFSSILLIVDGDHDNITEFPESGSRVKQSGTETYGQESAVVSGDDSSKSFILRSTWSSKT